MLLLFFKTFWWAAWWPYYTMLLALEKAALPSGPADICTAAVGAAGASP